MSDLTPEQRAIAEAQSEFFVSTLLRRYGLNETDVPEILDSLRWMKEHRAFMQRVQSGGTLSLIALLVTAIGSAVWQGVKSMLTGIR